MNIFISGGCKNGKSHHAQELVRCMAEEKSLPMYYIATMISTGPEDDIRIKRHIRDREGWGFITLEQPRNLCDLLDRDDVNPKGAFLMDSITALLQNEMFGIDGSYNERAGHKVAQNLQDFANATGNTVFVSDYIYSDARDYDEWIENYRRSLAYCDRETAKACGRVIETCFGIFRELKTVK